MENTENTGLDRAPWWILPALWGLDAPLAALAWGYAGARLMDIQTINAGPLMLLAVSTWVVTLFSRLSETRPDTRAWYAPFYRAHYALFGILLLAVTLAMFWMTFYFVGAYFIYFCMLPLALLLCSGLPLLRSLHAWRDLCWGFAFSFACAAPVSYYAFIPGPLSPLFQPLIWCAGVVFFLYCRMRRNWRYGSPSSAFLELEPLLFAAFFLYSALSSKSDPTFYFYMAIFLAAICLQALNRMARRFDRLTVFASAWFVMATPPLLAMLIHLR